jgi:hypothetical protein
MTELSRAILAAAEKDYTMFSDVVGDAAEEKFAAVLADRVEEKKTEVYEPPEYEYGPNGWRPIPGTGKGKIASPIGHWGTTRRDSAERQKKRGLRIKGDPDHFRENISLDLDEEMGEHAKIYRTIIKSMAKPDYNEEDHAFDSGQAARDHEMVNSIVKKHYPEIHREVAGHLKKALSAIGKTEQASNNGRDSEKYQSQTLRHEGDAINTIKDHITGRKGSRRVLRGHNF